MGLSDWFANRRKKKDAEEIERAQHRGTVETADERRYTSNDFEGMVADNRAAGRIGEANVDGVNRMGDF
jgi:hypothetical protein